MRDQPSCGCSIYLKGDDLDPDVITRLLGVSATRAHRRGETRVGASGREVARSTGLSRVTSDFTAVDDVSSAIYRLVTHLLARGQRIADLPGVEEAYVDVFIAQETDDEGGRTFEFVMERETVDTLNKLELPVRFTIAAVRAA